MNDADLELWIEDFKKKLTIDNETAAKYTIGNGEAMKIESDGGSTSYYELPQDAKELLDLIEFRNMNFNVGNIFKACYRLNRKAGIDDLYDINKIIFYAEREKARLEKLQNEVPKT